MPIGTIQDVRENYVEKNKNDRRRLVDASINFNIDYNSLVYTCESNPKKGLKEIILNMKQELGIRFEGIRYDSFHDLCNAYCADVNSVYEKVLRGVELDSALKLGSRRKRGYVNKHKDVQRKDTKDHSISIRKEDKQEEKEEISVLEALDKYGVSKEFISDIYTYSSRKLDFNGCLGIAVKFKELCGLSNEDYLDKVPYAIVRGTIFNSKVELLQNYQLSLLDFKDDSVKAGFMRAKQNYTTYLIMDGDKVRLDKAMLMFNGNKDSLLAWIADNKDKVVRELKSKAVGELDIDKDVIDCKEIIKQLL